MNVSEDVAVVPYEERFAGGIAGVCRELGWPSFGDPAVAARACGAPGVSTAVAVVADQDTAGVDGGVDADGGVVGFAYVLSDGVVQAYLAQMGVRAAYRRRGIARRLMLAAFEASGARRLDLLSTRDGQPFYRSFEHRTEMAGFRLHLG